MPTRSQRHVYEIQGTVNGLRPDTGGNRPPSITSSPNGTVLEGQAFSKTLTASEAVTWAKSGGDAGLFTLTGNTLSMVARDFEAPADADHDNVYVCTLTATSVATSMTTVQTFSLTVTDVFEDVTAPTITSAAAVSLNENTALTHALTANEAVTWTKVGGADQALFTLTGSTLTMTAKDFEAPTDADGNNTYVVQVRATDTAGNQSNQTITVTILDVVEAGASFAVTDSHQQTTDIVANPFTLAAKSIGAASADRIVLFALQYLQAHTGRTIPTVTCDGVEMMLAASNERQQNAAPCQIYAIEKPAGTTAVFAINFHTPDANPNVTRFTAFIVAARNMSLAPTDMTGASNFASGTGSTTHTLDAKVDNAGMAIVLSGCDMASGSPTESWTGVTNDMSLVTETSMRTNIGHYESTAAQASRPINYVVNGGGASTIATSGACCLSMSPLAAAKKLVWDTFDRADAALNASAVPSGFTNLGNWNWDARTPTINIVGGRLTNNNTNGPGTVYSFDIGSPDMWAEWMCDNVSSSNGPFAIVRAIDYDNFYGIRVANTSIECFQRNASAMNSILSTNWDASFGTLFRIEAESTQLRLYRNGQLMNTFVLAAPFLTPTKAGIVGRSSVLANFLGKFRCGAL